MALEVGSVIIYDMDNAGCNNGNYPDMEVRFTNGETYHGMTCACGNGCSCTDREPKVGMKFLTWDDFYDYLRS